MPGWNTLKHIPSAAGMTLQTRVDAGWLATTVRQGTGAGHQIVVEYHGPDRKRLNVVAWIDPTDQPNQPASGAVGQAAGPSAADASAGDPVTSAPSQPLAYSVETGLGAGSGDVGEKPADPVELHEPAPNDPRPLCYVDLPDRHRWVLGTLALGKNSPVERELEKAVFHYKSATCGGGKQHVVRVHALIETVWPGGAPEPATLEFTVNCH